MASAIRIARILATDLDEPGERRDTEKEDVVPRQNKKDKKKNGTTLIKKVKECKRLVYDVTVGEALAI